MHTPQEEESIPPALGPSTNRWELIGNRRSSLREKAQYQYYRSTPYLSRKLRLLIGDLHLPRDLIATAAAIFVSDPLLKPSIPAPASPPSRRIMDRHDWARSTHRIGARWRSEYGRWRREPVQVDRYVAISQLTVSRRNWCMLEP